MSAFTSEYVSLMMARNMFCVERHSKQSSFLQNDLRAIKKKAKSDPHHENEENEEDKSVEVDRSQHRIGLVNLGELKISQDDAELRESA